MITVSDDFKRKVVEALIAARDNFDGGDIPYAHKHGVQPSIYSRMKNGEIDKLLANGKWITLGRELGVTMNDRNWKIARTEVFEQIEREVIFCQENAKSRIYVDDCGIGKTFTAKHLSKTLKNCFYIDASQYNIKKELIKGIAKALGVDANDPFQTVKENVKYYLRILPNPIIIIDEAGDLAPDAFLLIKELWNATEGACGWYMMGADGLRAVIERSIKTKKVGFRELFSRFSEKFSTTVPVGKDDRLAFYKKLISDVLYVNMEDKTMLPEILKQCIVQEDKVDPKSRDKNINIGGLRRAESLLILNQKQ